jgi:hypothetical protein
MIAADVRSEHGHDSVTEMPGTAPMSERPSKQVEYNYLPPLSKQLAVGNLRAMGGMSGDRIVRAGTSTGARKAMPHTENNLDQTLAIEVWGISADGYPFRQPAVAVDFSSAGARIFGVACRLKAGDAITMRNGNQTTLARIVWVCEPKSPNEQELGVQFLAPDPQSSAVPSPPTQYAGGRERRRSPRHAVLIELEIADHTNRLLARTKTSDISLHGCYVETLMPLPVGERVRLRLWLWDEAVVTTAIVVTNHPGVGMGLEFLTPSQGMLDLIANFLAHNAPR